MYDDDFEIIEDDSASTSPSNFSNTQKIPDLGISNKSNNSKGSNNNNNGDKSKPVGSIKPNIPNNATSKGAADNGNKFKEAGNIAKMAGDLNSSDPAVKDAAMKNLGKDVLKQVAKRVIQYYTGGAVPEPVLDKAINKAAETKAVDKVLDQTVKEVKRQKKIAIVMTILSVIPPLFGLLMFLVILVILFQPVFGAGDVSQSGNKYEVAYYNELDRVASIYKQKCFIEMDKEIITTTVFYDQIISTSDDDFEYIDEEGNIEEMESMMPKFNFQNKDGKILGLAQKLYPGFTFSTSDEETDDEKYDCSASYYGYKDYIVSSYMPSNYKGVDLTSTSYNELADDILAIAGFSDNTGSGTTGQIIVGAGIAGVVPLAVLENSGSPLGPQYLKQTSCFGFYSSTNCTSHNGVDLVSNVANPILYSIADGEITALTRSAIHCQPDWVNGKACSVCANSAGNGVTIKHTVVENGETVVFYSQYFHLDSVSLGLKVGDKVSRGQEIGVMGNTGCSTATHLHFNLLNAQKQRYNPEELLVYLNYTIRSGCEEARRVCINR